MVIKAQSLANQVTSEISQDVALSHHIQKLKVCMVAVALHYHQSFNRLPQLNCT
jgi:hypothetical protein